MKKLIAALTAVFAVFFAASVILYFSLGKAFLLSAAITFGTFFYHFAMRLAVGGIVNRLFYGKIDCNKKQFQPKKFEKNLYRFLRVKNWKNRMPTYNPASFDLRLCTPQEVLQNSCIAELGHELIMLFSFLPLLLIIPFGEPAAFILTSVFAALADSVFVIIQRYNRPRLLRVVKMQSKKDDFVAAENSKIDR